MLCRFMINAGLGVPHEYFNPVIMRQIAPRFGLARDIAGLKWRCRGLRDHLPFGKADRATEVDFLTKYLTALIPKRCQGGIFGAKIHYDQYIRVLDNPVGQRLLNGGLFVHIFREDLLEQAVSRNFAYVTGRWGIDKTVTTPPSARTDLLDVTGIDRELETLADEDRGWRVFFAKNGLFPISISCVAPRQGREAGGLSGTNLTDETPRSLGRGDQGIYITAACSRTRVAARSNLRDSLRRPAPRRPHASKIAGIRANH